MKSDKNQNNLKQAIRMITDRMISSRMSEQTKSEYDII